MKADPIYTGKVVMVFASHLWRKNGGDLPTDNFMRKAVIIKIYSEDDLILDPTGRRAEWQYRVPRTLVDVRFEYDDSFISKGHFADNLEEVPYTP